MPIAFLSYFRSWFVGHVLPFGDASAHGGDEGVLGYVEGCIAGGPVTNKFTPRGIQRTGADGSGGNGWYLEVVILREFAPEASEFVGHVEAFSFCLFAPTIYRTDHITGRVNMPVRMGSGFDRFKRAKARADDAEAKYRRAEKTAWDKIRFSALRQIERTRLLKLSTEAFYGALLEIDAGVGDEKRVARWEKTGAEALAREAAGRERKKEEIVITFPIPVPRRSLLEAALKQAGLRVNGLRHGAEGMAVYEEAAAVAAAHDGTVERVARRGRDSVETGSNDIKEAAE